MGSGGGGGPPKPLAATCCSCCGPGCATLSSSSFSSQLLWSTGTKKSMAHSKTLAMPTPKPSASLHSPRKFNSRHEHFKGDDRITEASDTPASTCMFSVRLSTRMRLGDRACRDKDASARRSSSNKLIIVALSGSPRR